MRAQMAVILGVVLLVALGATGCAAHGQVTTGTPPPPATAAPAPGSTSTFGSGTPTGYQCPDLLNDATLAGIDAQLTPDADFAPTAGSAAEEAVAIQGLACSWTDASSQTTLVITVAKPDAATLAKLKTLAGTRTTQFGTVASAYTQGTQLQLVNSDGYWATADSPLLADPAKLTAIGQILLEELPAG